ncbi:MAG: hypothetical protein LBH32_06990 [Dysgonamonadaceae bacterium]|jgi:hypothetical protein|nr:hypothetical protein [Dysgonamonadaceae bacterium]
MRRVKFEHLLSMAFLVAILGTAVMLLWNWLVPDIFGLQTINYWQAVGLFVLAKILFGGKGHHLRHLHHEDAKNMFRDKWMKMSPEEQKEFVKKRRENVRNHWHARFGHGQDFSFDSNNDANSTSVNEDE